MDAGSILSTVFENFTRLAPVRVIHSYQQGVKFRFGRDVALLKTGVHFFWPFFESIETDSIATRYILTPVQDLVTRDGSLVSISSSLAYEVSDFRKHWVRLQDREDSILNLTQRCVAHEVPNFSFEDIQKARSVDEESEGQLRDTFCGRIYTQVHEEIAPFGIKVNSYGLVTFTKPRPFRIITDNGALQMIHNKE